MPKKRRPAPKRTVVTTGDCHKGEIQIFDGWIYAGALAFEAFPKDLVSITSVDVGKPLQKRHHATAMYKEFCRIARKCKFADIEGTVAHTAALKARLKVFPNTTLTSDLESGILSKRKAIRVIEKYEENVLTHSQVRGCKTR